MTVIGIDEIVNVPGVFDPRSVGVFVGSIARGVRNFYDRLSVSLVGGALAVGALAAPLTATLDAFFTEPPPLTSESDDQWAASVSRLGFLIDGMRANARPAHAVELSALAMNATATARTNEQDVNAWAKTLASEAGHLDD